MHHITNVITKNWCAIFNYFIIFNDQTCGQFFGSTSLTESPDFIHKILFIMRPVIQIHEFGIKISLSHALSMP